MRTPILTAFTAALVLAATGGAQTPAGAQPGPEQLSLEAALAIYLAEDCGSGEPDARATLTALLRFGDDAIPHLLGVVANGPASEVRSAVERDAKADFTRTREFLSQGGLAELEEQEVREMAQALTAEDYTSQRVRGLDASYRQRALNALVALRSKDLDAQLADIRQKIDDEDLRGWIEEAIAGLGE